MEADAYPAEWAGEQAHAHYDNDDVRCNASLLVKLFAISTECAQSKRLIVDAPRSARYYAQNFGSLAVATVGHWLKAKYQKKMSAAAGTKHRSDHQALNPKRLKMMLHGKANKTVTTVIIIKSMGVIKIRRCMPLPLMPSQSFRPQ